MTRGIVGGLLVAVTACGRIAFDNVVVTDTSTTDAEPGCWSAWRAGTVQMQPAAVIPELMSTMVQTNPYLASDGLHLYFDRGATGSRDVFRATRAAPGQSFGTAAIVMSLNSAADDARFAISADLSVGMLASFRGTANFDLYSTTSSDGPRRPWR